MTTNFLLTFNIERFYIFDFQFQFIHWFEWFLSITSKNHSVNLFISRTIQINCSIGPIGIASFYLWFENESLSSKYPVAQTGRCNGMSATFLRLLEILQIFFKPQSLKHSFSLSVFYNTDTNNSMSLSLIPKLTHLFKIIIFYAFNQHICIDSINQFHLSKLVFSGPNAFMDLPTNRCLAKQASWKSIPGKSCGLLALTFSCTKTIFFWFVSSSNFCLSLSSIWTSFWDKKVFLTLIGKFLGNFCDRFTGKLIQWSIGEFWGVTQAVLLEKFQWMSFPVKQSVWRPGKWKFQKTFWMSFPWFANKG